MGLLASIGASVSANLQAIYARRGGREKKADHVNGDGRRGLLLSAVIAATQVNDSKTELLQSIYNSLHFQPCFLYYIHKGVFFYIYCDCCLRVFEEIPRKQGQER